VQRTVPSKARHLQVARKDPSIRLRRPQDDLLRKSDCPSAVSSGPNGFAEFILSLSKGSQ